MLEINSKNKWLLENIIIVLFVLWLIPALLFIFRLYLLNYSTVNLVEWPIGLQYILFVLFQIGFIASIVSGIIGLVNINNLNIKRKILIISLIPLIQPIIIFVFFGPFAGIFAWLFMSSPIKSW